MVRSIIYQIRAYLIATWLLGQAFLCTAQEPFQCHYGVEEGLPVAEVDQISFSHKGELWARYISSDYISRFDGVNWTHYHMPSLGLPMPLVFFTEDKHGKWLYNQDQNHLQLVCFTSKGTWKKYLINRWVHPYTELKDGHPMLMDAACYKYQYDSQVDSFVRSAKPVYRIELGEQFFNRVSSFKSMQYITTKNVVNNKYFIRYGTNFKQKLEMMSPESFKPYLLTDSRVMGLIWDDQNLVWYDNKKTRSIQIVLPNGRKGKILGHFTIYPWKPYNHHPKSGWMVKDLLNHQLYIYTINEKGEPILVIGQIPGNSYQSLAQDPQGNWWLSTSTGIVRSDKNLLSFSETSQEMVSGLSAINEGPQGQIWFAGYNGQGGFSIFDGEKLQLQTFDPTAIPVLPGTYRNASGTLYFFTQRYPGIASIQQNRLTWVKIPDQQEQLNGYYFLRLSDARIALGLQARGLGIVKEIAGKFTELRLISQTKGMLLDNVLTISEDRNGRLWLGRHSQGIAIYDPKRDTAITWLRSTSIPGSIGAISSINDEKGTLWLGANNGLYRLPQAHKFDYLHGNLFEHLKKIQLPGLDTSIVTFLANTQRYIVAGTQKGIYFLDKQYVRPGLRIFTLKYNQDISGSGSEQNAAFVDSKGYLWVGTQEGATRIDLHNLRFDTSITRINLSHFQAGDASIPIQGKKIGRIPLRKRNIRFSFLPSGNLFLKDDLYFNLTVTNSLGDTMYQRNSTRDKDHHLDYIPYGHYNLRITAFKHNVPSGQEIYYFKIPRQHDENPWVWIALALFIGVPWYLNQMRKQQQKIAAEKAQRIQDGLKMQNLSSFFNPHFINNALHWIQSRYRKDPETTLLIGRLADNVDVLYRNTQSGKSYHSLAQELELVHNYLLIQQVRFSNEFSVNFDLPPTEKLEESIPVPALLLQIHAENAIEKGIRNRKGANKFQLKVTQESNGFQIIIEDDGRGRPNKPENFSIRKGSTVVMNELIQLLNTYNTDPITIRHEDFIYHTPDSGGYGTRVIIHLPKQYRYEFS